MSAFAAAITRPPFTLGGRVVARREIRLSRTYTAGQDIPVEREGLSERQLAVFWSQYLIDTPPASPAPSKHQHRR